VASPQEVVYLIAVAQRIIDVWDVQTLDSELLLRLETRADLIRAYFEADHEIRPRPGTVDLAPENLPATDFYELLDAIGQDIGTRTIRAFHYTRLTEDEVASLLQNGIHVSTPETLRPRLDVIVAWGGLTRADAARLYAESPFHSDQRRVRSGKFWLTSHPLAVVVWCH
jgi:hypothetical protein